MFHYFFASFGCRKQKATLPNRPARIILLGDSITQLSFSANNAGWGAHLADQYQRRADGEGEFVWDVLYLIFNFCSTKLSHYFFTSVLNRGKGGYNTDWFLSYLNSPEGKQDIFGSVHCAMNVRIVTIFFGANDASDALLNPRHHVPLPRFKDNLKKIVSAIIEHAGHHVKIIIICPPPVHHESRLKHQIERHGTNATGKLERTLQLSGAYAKAAAEVANNLKIPHLNLWKDMQKAAPGPGELWSKYLDDGLHLSREGNIFVGQKLIELVQKNFPELSVRPCPHTGCPGNSTSFCPGLDQLGAWHDHINNRNPL